MTRRTLAHLSGWSSSEAPALLGAAGAAWRAQIQIEPPLTPTPHPTDEPIMVSVTQPTRAREVNLEPGAYFVGDDQHRVRTLLGSCVSIILWSPHRRFGAMSHYLLARRDGSTGLDADPRYGDEAFALMCRGLRARGIDPATCQAKLFGGGDMFGRTGGPRLLDVGRSNGLAARALAEAAGIPVIAESLFGVGHRRIVFEPATGSVRVQHHGLSQGGASIKTADLVAPVTVPRVEPGSTRVY